MSSKISAGLSQLNPPDADLPPSPNRWIGGHEFLRTDAAARMDPVLRLLLTSDGTITTSLQALMRTPIGVEIIRQEEIQVDKATAEFLTAKPGSVALSREVWLTAKGRRLVVASSIILLEGLHRPLLQALRTGEKPLGLLLRETGEPVVRDRLQIAFVADPSAIKSLGPTGAGPSWVRRYRMTLGSKSTASIQEQFIGDLTR